MQKIETQRQLEEITRLEEERERIEREMLEELKSKEARDIIEFDRQYRQIKTEFIGQVNGLSEKIKDEVISIEQLKELTAERLDAVRNYKKNLIQIGNVPEPLKTFFSYELEFLESDIKTVNLVLSYYNSEDYSNSNNSAIEKSYEDTRSLLLKAEEELQRVYSQYELEYLLEESS